MAVDVDRLVHVEHPIGPAAQGVEQVVRVFGAEPAQHHLAEVGLAIAVGVLEVQQLGRVGDIDATVSRQHTGRDQQVVGKHRRFLGHAVAVGVLEDDDLVVRALAWLNVRIEPAAHEPEPPLRIPVHLDRLGDVRIGGKEVHLKAVRQLEGRHLGIGRGVRNVLQLQVPLAVGTEEWTET